jgi:hypothetical protein
MESMVAISDEELQRFKNIDFAEIEEDIELFSQDETVLSALKRGVDLNKYGRELASDLKQAEVETIEKYIENSDRVIDLHLQMQSCDAVLARMQEMLLGFQADLGGISEEIRNLQEQSYTMSIKLKNRRAAEEKIHQFLHNSSPDPDLAECIITPLVNDEFLKAVISLRNKFQYLQQSEPALDGSSLGIIPLDTFAGRALIPELEKLKMRSITKSKEYFVMQISAIKKPKTNIQMLQQSSLVKYAPLLHFLQEEAPHIAEEIRSLYIDTMGKTIFNLFKNYHSQLVKLVDLVGTSKLDVIAVEDSKLKSMFTTKVETSTKRYDSFSLGDRHKILDELENEPILVHIATAEGMKVSYEVILRSVVKHLIDASTNEFLFLLDFFQTNARDTFTKIFGRTLSLIIETLENYLLTCYDAVGLLLMIKLTNMQRLVMQRRRMPVLDSFFDRLSMLLWPRFKYVFQANLNSIKSVNVRKMGVIELSPHVCSKRYAELVATVLFLQGGAADSLGVGGGGENMLYSDLQLLRTEMVGLLERMAELLPTVRDKKIFLINNIDQMLVVLQERGVVDEEAQRLEDLQLHHRELFAEEELKEVFPRLISFIVQTEQAVNESFSAGRASSNGSLFSLDELLVETLVREFAASWRQGVEKINENIISFFANFRSGMEILKQVNMSCGF